MAMMYRTDILLYPNIGDFVQNYLPTLPSHGRVWSAFVRHGTLPDAQAREAIQWSRGPQLRFTNQYIPRSLAAQFVVGPNPRSAAIWIKADIARAIENDWELWQARIRLEALLLHEMTHWGDWLRDDVMASNETGVAFEREAYHGFRPVRFDYRLFEYPMLLRDRAPPRSLRR